MTKKADPAAIGGFIVGAFILLIGAVLVFSGDRFFTRKLTYTMYFDGSLKGLAVGAPVTIRGVKIGAVKDIQVQYDTSSSAIGTPVTVEVYGKKVSTVGSNNWMGMGEVQTHIQKLVDQGLRATLALQSLVTGQLYIELEFVAGASPARIESRDGEFVFPTAVSRLSELTEEVQSLPLGELANKALEALEGINRVVNSKELAGALGAVENAATGVDKLVVDLNRESGAISKSLRATLENTDRLIGRADRSLEGIDQQLVALVGQLAGVVEAAEKSMTSVRDTLNTYRALPTQDSAMGYELHQALRELSAAARSIRTMADYLEQHPEALIKGKPEN